MADNAVLLEYIAAREGYEAATKKPNSHAPPARISHGDPRLLRYREARAALDRMVSCGSCGTQIQTDAMTGTKCACAPTIPNDREGKFGLFKGGVLAILDAWVVSLAIPHPTNGELVAWQQAKDTHDAVVELLAAQARCDALEDAWHEAQINAIGDESPGWWAKEARKLWQRLGRAKDRRLAAVRRFHPAVGPGGK